MGSRRRADLNLTLCSGLLVQIHFSDNLITVPSLPTVLLVLQVFSIANYSPKGMNSLCVVESWAQPMAVTQRAQTLRLQDMRPPSADDPLIVVESQVSEVTALSLHNHSHLSFPVHLL